MKRVQIWYRKNLPTEAERLMFQNADVVILGYPFRHLGWAGELKKAGHRVIPYISFYKAPTVRELDESPDWDTGSPARSECLVNPFWQNVAADRHPEFLARDEAGRPRRPFNNDGYAAGWNRTLQTVDGYRNACLDGVRALLSAGFDGCFLDNVHIQEGAEHEKGWRKGEFPPETEAAFTRLVLEAADIVHANRPTNLFVVNGTRNKAILDRVDAYCMESFFFSWGWDMTFFTRADCRDNLARFQRDAREVNAQPIGISYLGYTGRALREDAYSALALFWILDMAFCDGNTVLDRTFLTRFAARNRFQGAQEGALCFEAEDRQAAWTSDFYRLDLKKPVTTTEMKDDILVKHYEGGFCAFNPTPTLKKLSFSWTHGDAHELATGNRILVYDGKGHIWLAPFSGRIVVASV
ncbi:MAG: hypothetical protein HY343_09170 [Lentisphaerae bacterium]|nr:hypothetical protein [Lentisphaerota bacterium]